MKWFRRIVSAAIAMQFIVSAGIVSGQDALPRQPSRDTRPVVVSPEIAADRTVTFRILAPKANAVILVGGDIPGNQRGFELKKGDDGVWSVTSDPIDPGTYRYHFDVDDVAMNDPSNPATSESNATSWSLFVIPGSEAQDVKDVPHGSVARLNYYSTSLKRFRRMQVYVPPGYESGTGTLPVLYLLHGSSDSDDAWPTIGRAGFILDNLITAGKAKPMLVVMPHGHTSSVQTGPRDDEARRRQREEFLADFVADIRPTIEKTYRVRNDRAGRAIAGLSMGGSQSLEIAMRNLADYGYIGVFSSGVIRFGDGPNPRPGPSWEDRHLAALDHQELKQGLKLIWFATGKEDFLLRSSEGTVEILKKHGFNVVYNETAGGHTWINWRDYLHDFAPLLFNETH